MVSVLPALTGTMSPKYTVTLRSLNEVFRHEKRRRILPIREFPAPFHFQKIQKVHWRQVTLLIEIIILFGVGYISFEQNLVANSLTSFACGLQVQAFRKIHGKGYATTMCIGNLRTGTHEMCNYLCTKKVQHLQSGLLYYLIILTFIIGAILGNFCIRIFSAKAIWISVSLLVLAFILMFVDREKDEAFQ